MAISQVAGEAKTPTNHVPGYAIGYQTPGALFASGVQPVAVVRAKTRPTATIEKQKRLNKWTRFHPLVFCGEKSEDTQDFIYCFWERLQNNGVVESNRVN